ncbi:MAG TPA: hypothetical protein VLQ20_08155 [Planococcus sp. (in: firmicutes)]|nr:hypothetical protein [Planococcus sp. (in: firmicutes)]
MKWLKKWTFLFLLLALFFGPFVIWQLGETKEEKIVILDKTVPTEDKREHRALSWVLKHLKYTSFKGEDDYFGFFPENEEKVKSLPTDLKGTDIIYLADTYGVYDDDEKLIYGGLAMDEWAGIKKQVLDEPTTLVMEFNTFASPTKNDVKEDVASFLHLQTSGWTGRAFMDLDRENEELTESLIQLYEANGETWAFQGKGFVLVNEEKGKVLVLSEENGDLNNPEMLLEFTERGAALTGLKKSTAYTYWFDITIPEEKNDILANYRWDLSASGKEMLAAESVPLSFPAVLARTVESSNLVYFAGDFADTAKVSSVYRYTGFAKMRAWLTPSALYPEEAFFWKTYVPLLKNILSMEKSEPSVKSSVKTAEKQGLMHTAKLNGDRFDVFENGKWKTITVKGVNMGMGTAGSFPGEAAITEAEYYNWMNQIAEMNANTIRVYTLHPPGFYNALKRYNEEHSDKPLYVFHGVWIDEEPLAETLDAFTPEIEKEFQEEMKRLADVIHGNADIPARVGHASGSYRADISPYVIGWVLGIEWDPVMVDNMKKKHAGLGQYEGTFVETEQAEPMEIWLASQMDRMMVYEAEEYRWTRPMSFTNWVTTDLLEHPAEPQQQEDMVSVNPNHIKQKNGSDLFASYHVYPYYPDFLNLEERYLNYKDSTGEGNSYAGYLHDLRQAHDMPVLIAEFGVPASRGMTHRNVYGWNQGFISEEQQGKTLIRLYDEILAENMLGGLVFSWQDEWFKRTWNTMDLDDPERRPFWSNAQTNEQQFGLLSLDRLLIQTDGKTDDWQGIVPLYNEDQALSELSVTHDERYLYVKTDIVNGQLPTLYFDVHPVIGSTVSGDVAFTENNPDFIASFEGSTKGQLLVDAYYDPFLYEYGIKQGMMEPQPRKPVNNSSIYNPIRFALNKKLIRPDTGEVLPFDFYETGELMHGNSNPDTPDYNSLADYFINEEKKTVEVRIPWLLLNVKDPSQLKATGDLYKDGVEAELAIKGIGVAASVELENGELETLPTSPDGKLVAIKNYGWEAWNDPQYKERLKSSYYMLQQRFSEIDQ